MTEQNNEQNKSTVAGAHDDPADMLDIEVGKNTPTTEPTPAPTLNRPTAPRWLDRSAPSKVEGGNGVDTPANVTPIPPTDSPITPKDPTPSAPRLDDERVESDSVYPGGQPVMAHSTGADDFVVTPEYQPATLPVEEAPGENWLALIARETLETVVLAVVIFLLIRVAIQNYRIEGSSMEPNFHHGEYLLVNKLAYRLGEYERGDVIVFKYPGDTTKDYIKRVIGLPGDVVEIRDGVLYVNDQMVSEPYQTMPMNFLNEPPRIVEAGTLYVMGDNRPASSDTRDWGLLNQDLVIGQAWLAIFPLDTFGLVDHPELHFTPGMAQGP